MIVESSVWNVVVGFIYWYVGSVLLMVWMMISFYVVSVVWVMNLGVL